MAKTKKTIEQCFCFGTNEGKCFGLTPVQERIKNCDGKRIFCPFYKTVEQVEKIEAKAKERALAMGYEFTPASSFREEYCS